MRSSPGKFFAVKNGKSYYGYKNHINVDVAHGFIRQHSVTDAAVHDSQELGLGLKDLTFNLKRYVFWQKRGKSQAQCA
jgi:transposase, IS5 family